MNTEYEYAAVSRLATPDELAKAKKAKAAGAARLNASRSRRESDRGVHRGRLKCLVGSGDGLLDHPVVQRVANSVAGDDDEFGECMAWVASEQEMISGWLARGDQDAYKLLRHALRRVVNETRAEDLTLLGDDDQNELLVPVVPDGSEWVQRELEEDPRATRKRIRDVHAAVLYGCYDPSNKWLMIYLAKRGLQGAAMGEFGRRELERMIRLVEDLREDDQKLVAAYYQDGRTQAGIAAELGVSRVRVSHRLTAVLDRLASRFMEDVYAE